ncbi:MAG: glycosyltransferase family 1 protein [Bryobacteraceae bacterium]|jgi:glycosyltransferase involved in cell wall biosynthesis
MNIGFDVSQTGCLKAGCGYFADGLIRQLSEVDHENQYVLYPAVGDHFWDPDCSGSTFSVDRPNFRRTRAPASLESSQAFWRNPPADFEQQLGSPDIFHANNFFCPELRKARLVYTLYDLGYLEEPAWTTEANRAGCFQGTFNASLRADRIIAISEYSRSHFLRTFPHYPENRIVVVYPGSRFESRSGLPRPARLSQLKPDSFWLSVATLEPRKNHRRLIEAYRKVKAEAGSTFPLVLVGGHGWLMEDFEKTLTGLKAGTDVILTGYLDDSELQWLYENCFAFVYPSLFEGFGLPVLEAMSLGAAVIASKATSLPEIVGTAGLLVNPCDVEEIAAAIRRLTEPNGCREALRELAPPRARLFSWQSAARQVLTLYEELAQSTGAADNTCGDATNKNPRIEGMVNSH